MQRLSIFNISILLGCLSLIGACSDESVSTAEPPPGDTHIEMDLNMAAETVAIPEGITKCETCHIVNDLGIEQADESVGIKSWLSTNGVGLVRYEPAFPAPGLHLILYWPERGRHDEKELELDTCNDCHPTSEYGIGHGQRTYPEKKYNLVFKGGETCAETCHIWLNDSVTETGFTVTAGNAPKYSGTFRPSELLEASENAHAELWRKGSRPTTQPMKISAFNPGCGGCHNVSAEYHGTIPTCVSCHKFSGPQGEALRTRIVERIIAHKQSNDPGFGEAEACGYCHAQDDVLPERSNAVCYNCHLSAHQPLNSDGKPHFWPYEE